MVESLKQEGNYAMADSMAQVVEVPYDTGKMDLDLHALYLNIFRGYQIKEAHLIGNQVFIYFDLLDSPPIILQPRNKYNGPRDI